MIHSKHLDIPTSDGVCDAYAAYPQNKARTPAVLMYMDAYGPRPVLYQMADRLASYGYYVLLPNSFYRVRRAPFVDSSNFKDPTKFPEEQKKVMALVPTLTPALALQDAAVFLEFLQTQKQASPGKIGIVGYCMGGTLGLRTAAQYPNRVACVASFHAGRLATDAADSPHLLAPKIRAELYLAYADKDPSLPPEQIEKFETALKTQKVKFKAETYSGAAHGFTMQDLPVHNASALERHWKALLELLDRNLSS